MQGSDTGPLDGITVGGGDGIPLAIQAILLIIPILAVIGFVTLIIRAFWVPNDFPWRPTRILLKKPDAFTHEYINGPVMERVNGGIRQYRAMNDAEWAKSKWKKPIPREPQASE